MFFDWFLSGQASNFGVFLGGGTAFLALVVGFFGFSRWRKEKRLEKRSTISEEALSFFETAESKGKNWLFWAATCHIYNRHSLENERIYQSASKEGKEQFEKAANDDEYELSRFCRQFNNIEKEFIIAKNRAARLGNREIDGRFKELNQLIGKFPRKLAHYHHPNLAPEKTIKPWKFLSEEAPKQFEEICGAIKLLLYRELHFVHSNWLWEKVMIFKGWIWECV